MRGALRPGEDPDRERFIRAPAAFGRRLLLGCGSISFYWAKVKLIVMYVRSGFLAPFKKVKWPSTVQSEDKREMLSITYES